MMTSRKRNAVLSLTVILVILVVVVMFTFRGCNKQIFDGTYNFNYAYVCWPDGSSEKIAIKSWNDYEGDQIQIKTSSGNTYLFHSSNCVLASE